PDCYVEPGLFASYRGISAGGNRYEDRAPHWQHDPTVAGAHCPLRQRPATTRTIRGKSPSASQAGSVQEQGHPVYRRSAALKGRQDGAKKQIINKTEKKQIRTRIHQRIRRKLRGTTERPRLAVFRSVSHIYAQVIDDSAGKTLASASSVDKSAKTNGG